MAMRVAVDLVDDFAGSGDLDDRWDSTGGPIGNPVYTGDSQPQRESGAFGDSNDTGASSAYLLQEPLGPDQGIEATIGPGDDQIWLFVRLSDVDPADGYYLYRWGDYIEIGYVTNDSETEITSKTTGYSIDPGDKLGLDVVGTSIKAYVNGVEELSGTNSTYTDGRVGLRVVDAGQFNDVYVGPGFSAIPNIYGIRELSYVLNDPPTTTNIRFYKPYGLVENDARVAVVAITGYGGTGYNAATMSTPSGYTLISTNDLQHGGSNTRDGRVYVFAKWASASETDDTTYAVNGDASVDGGGTPTHVAGYMGFGVRGMDSLEAISDLIDVGTWFEDQEDTSIDFENEYTTIANNACVLGLGIMCDENGPTYSRSDPTDGDLDSDWITKLARADGFGADQGRVLVVAPAPTSGSATGTTMGYATGSNADPVMTVFIGLYPSLDQEITLTTSINSAETFENPTLTLASLPDYKSSGAKVDRYGNGDLTPAYPATVDEDDFAILYVGHSPNLTVSSTPTGFDILRVTDTHSIYYKVCAGTEDSSTVTVTLGGGSSGDGALAQIITYVNVEPTSPIATVGTTANGSGTSPSVGAISPSTDDSLVIVVSSGYKNNDAITHSTWDATDPDILTERTDADSGT